MVPLRPSVKTTAPVVPGFTAAGIADIGASTGTPETGTTCTGSVVATGDPSEGVAVISIDEPPRVELDSSVLKTAVPSAAKAKPSAGRSVATSTDADDETSESDTTTGSAPTPSTATIVAKPTLPPSVIVACVAPSVMVTTGSAGGQLPQAMSMMPMSPPVTTPSPFKSPAPAVPQLRSRMPRSPPSTIWLLSRSAGQSARTEVEIASDAASDDASAAHHRRIAPRRCMRR